MASWATVGWEEVGVSCQVIQSCSIEYRDFHQNSQEAMETWRSLSGDLESRSGFVFLGSLNFPRQVLVSLLKGEDTEMQQRVPHATGGCVVSRVCSSRLAHVCR